MSELISTTFNYIIHSTLGAAIALLINKHLENSKAKITQKKQWEECWADRFIQILILYSSTITNILNALDSLVNFYKPDEQDDINKQINSIKNNLYEARRLEWELSIMVNYAPKNLSKVHKISNNINLLIGNIIKNKYGDLEELRKLQQELHKYGRSAHAEILGLKIKKMGSFD
ncbi:hypothetical protein EP073_09370 [Geovibrio thiophilus]|uniref:Uncharacterized protein n=1 Tax=Geovibrio thiophilus TaxID=139438 RepID=A0A410JZL4_9BACT|nr:hypothetical protein [Geovibrio thiophilus]QAR33602.1 hypothetical protein EP073_09370 [Geovibrio thiophilus]